MSVHHELRIMGGDVDDETGLPRYEPGGTLPGVVRLDDQREVACRGVVVTARWRVSGRGTPDEGHAHEEWIHRGVIEPGQSVELPFEYRLPYAPWSYGGEVITIEWELEAKLDVPKGGDHFVSERFILAPELPALEGPRRRRGAATRKTGEIDSR